MDIKSIYESNKLFKNNNQPKLVKSYEKVYTNNDSYASDNTDTVKISAQASFKQNLDVKVKEYAKAAAVSGTLSVERLAQLKIDYQGDNCPVSSADVASSILRDVCGHNIQV